MAATCCSGTIPVSASTAPCASPQALREPVRVRQVLQQLDDEVGGAEEFAVGPEVRVVGRVVQDRSPGGLPEATGRRYD